MCFMRRHRIHTVSSSMTSTENMSARDTRATSQDLWHCTARCTTSDQLAQSVDTYWEILLRCNKALKRLRICGRCKTPGAQSQCNSCDSRNFEARVRDSVVLHIRLTFQNGRGAEPTPPQVAGAHLGGKPSLFKSIAANVIADGASCTGGAYCTGAGAAWLTAGAIFRHWSWYSKRCRHWRCVVHRWRWREVLYNWSWCGIPGKGWRGVAHRRRGINVLHRRCWSGTLHRRWSGTLCWRGSDEIQQELGGMRFTTGAGAA